MDMNNLTSSILTTLMLLFLSTCVVKLLNWAWFRPKKLDKLLRGQGLKGNSYRLFVGDAIDFVSVLKAEQKKPIKFSDDLPYHIMPYFKQIIGKYGRALLKLVPSVAQINVYQLFVNMDIGDTPFIWLGPNPTLLITDPYMTKEILSKPDIFQKPVPDPIGETLVGGLLYLEGHKWAQHRKIISPAFHAESLKGMTSLITLSCSNMINKWEAKVSNGGESSIEIDVWSYLYDLSGDMISRTALGSTYERGKVIFELQKEQLKLVLQYLPYYFIPGLRYFPTKSSRKIKANGKKIKSILTGIISEREKGIKAGETTRNDLLGMLMESNNNEVQENGNKNLMMSTNDVIEECKLFYIAGSESTSMLVSWTMVMLSRHQDWQTRAREEVLRVFGKNEPKFDELYRLKIMNMIFKEVLRLYPPAPIMMRAPLKTTKLGKLTIPVGVSMFLLTGLVHHDPLIWGDDVEEFKPERFAEGTPPAMNVPFSFVPFSAGPRTCIGQDLAMVEAKIVLAMILQRFTFELSPSYLHAPFVIMSLQPKYGVPLLFNKIQHN